MSSSIPAAPFSIMGRSMAPLRPKMDIAAAARSVGFLILLIRSATALNCCSGLRPLMSAKVRPRLDNSSQVDLPDVAASPIIFCILKRAFSKSSTDRPDIWAA